MQHINETNDRVLHVAMKHLIVTGNWLIHGKKALKVFR